MHPIAVNLLNSRMQRKVGDFQGRTDFLQTALDMALKLIPVESQSQLHTIVSAHLNELLGKDFKSYSFNYVDGYAAGAEDAYRKSTRYI